MVGLSQYASHFIPSASFVLVQLVSGGLCFCNDVAREYLNVLEALVKKYQKPCYGIECVTNKITDI